MDTLLAAADNLDDLLDELEKNEGEQTQPMQTSQSRVVKPKSAVTSDTNITKTNQYPTSAQSTNHLSSTGMLDNSKAKVESVMLNEKVTGSNDSANLQTQNCEDLMAQSEEIIANSMNIEDSASTKTREQTTSPNTLMNIFGALPESPAKSEIETPAMLFSPLNPFSASYAGPVTSYEGENLFFQTKHVGDGDVVESTVISNPFEIDGIETVDNNETITVKSGTSFSGCEQMPIALSNNFGNRNGVQSIDVPVVDHIESLSNLSDAHDSVTSTDELLQDSSITTDHTKEIANAGIDLLPTVDILSNESTSSTRTTSDEERISVSKNLDANVPYKQEGQVQSQVKSSLEPSPSPVSINLDANVSYQPEGQVQSQVKSSLEPSPSPVSMNLTTNVPHQRERQVQSTQIQSSPSSLSMNLNPNVSYQPERQETNSTGFMRDVEISKEEFDRFWEEVEDDSSDRPSQIEFIKNDNKMTVKPTLPHEQTLLDPTLNPSTSSNNLNTKIEPSTEESITYSSRGQPQGTATVVKSTDSTAHIVTAQNKLNISPDALVEVTSVSTSESQDTGDIAVPSSEALTSPVSVPYALDHASSRGSPTFPLQPKANLQTTQTEEHDSGHVESDAHRLRLDVGAHMEQNVDEQRFYPATPPPPYSEEMHVNYERSTSAPTSGQQQSAHLRRQEEEEDFSLLAIMESITRPGETKPIWIPDQDAPQCSNCAQKFTFTRRRHHCRACGRVFCANCCSERAQLKYLEFKEARVCLMCSLAIKQADAVAAQISQQRLQSRAINNARVPQPEMVESVQPIEQPPDSATPAENVQYQVATVPDRSQAEAAQGGNEVSSQEDLEVEGATAGAAAVKTVRFSDGTRPTHPDETPTTPPPPTRTNRLRKRHGAAIDQTNFDSLTLPPAIIAHGEDGTFAVQNDPDSNVLMGLLESGNKNPQTFVLNPNLFVHVKFVSHANRQCWCYWSEGMDCVGQREIVLVLERQGLGDRQISSDAFMFYKYIFDRARKGKIFNTSDYMPKSVMGVEEDGEVFNLDQNAGFLFVQATSQPLEGFSCLKKKLYWHPEGSANSQCDQPISGMLFAILVQKTEAPLATLFPLRLMLRLGIETKQYPCPLFSIRQRDPVFQEIGHTILAILCDFNNFKYRIIGVPGMRVVLSSNGHISVQIPCNRFRDTIRIMNSSNESVLAIGTGTYGPKLNGTNSTTATDAPCDSHLVCVQDNQTTSYHTEISSMKNVKPMNTGAAFVIFNGSLKSDGNHSAKCAIVEDGVMIQLLPEKMEELRSCLKSMEDFSVPLAPNSQNIPEQDTSESNQLEQSFLEVKWVDDDKAFNIGMFSPIDGTPFEGVVGFNVQGRSEQKGKKFILRWNQVFFLASTGNPLDLSRLAEQVANGCFLAFTPVIQELVKHRLRKIGVRVTIHPENVGYIAGGGQKDLPLACMNSLDEHLIQTIHSAANSVPAEQEAVVFELLFSVLLTKPSYRTA